MLCTVGCFAWVSLATSAAAVACTPATGADARCCNLTTAAEYGDGAAAGSLQDLEGKLNYDLDSADLSMAQAAAIGCCDGDDNRPCAVCLPPSPANETIAYIDRLVRVLRRWRCFGGGDRRRRPGSVPGQ